jgi:4-alpha-glucanotransferase
LDHRELLKELAEARGVEPGYWDINGVWHETTDELRRAILESMGVRCGSAAELEASLAAEERDSWMRLGPAVCVVTQGEPVAVFVSVEEPYAYAYLNAMVTYEDGARFRVQFNLSEWPTVAEKTIGGARWVRKRLEFGVAAPPGYHNISWELAGEAIAEDTALIVCPEKAYLPPALEQGERRAGLAVSLWGVRSRTTWGCGDFTALRRLIDWVVDAIGGAYIALNPLQAIHNRQPFNTSPYLPNSISYRNFLYLDIDAIREVGASEAAQRLRHDPATVREIEELNNAEFVEYERVAALKQRFLLLAFDWFMEHEYPGNSARAAAFREYVAREGQLLDRFALYSALDAYLHERNPNWWVWTDWPAEYQDPESEAVVRFGEQHRREILFYKFVQWLVDEQAGAAQAYALKRGMEIGLFHDLPLATDRCGFELWANREFYVSGCRVGAPPDDFSPKGQDWSFPPPNTVAHRRNGYRLFAESIAKAARHGGALRIDHVMRLFRLYWIPEGFDATQGTYVRDFAEDLLRVVALESHRHRVLIVGEDLGTVEPFMRESLARHGILSYRLLYFEKHADGRFKQPGEYPAQALVSSTTHDLPTLAGFWSGIDIETRFALGLLGDEQARQQVSQERARDKRALFEALQVAGLLPEGYPAAAAEGAELSGELHSAITGFLASTPCLLMTLNQEDLTKEPLQQNLPGTTWQYPNWRRKMRYTLEELDELPIARDYARMLDDWLRRTGRRTVLH